MTTFANIGEDLANIVCDFAFTTTYRDVFFSLKTYLRIQCFNMPQSLLCPRIFSQKYLRFLDSPMIVFEPISAFQDYRALFNWNEIYFCGSSTSVGVSFVYLGPVAGGILGLRCRGQPCWSFVCTIARSSCFPRPFTNPRSCKRP